MFAHVDMLAAAAWLMAVIVTNAMALAVAIGCVRIQKRELWLVALSTTTLILGSVTAALGFGQGGERPGPFDVLLITPLLAGIGGLIRWLSLRR